MSNITLTIPNDDHIALRAFGKALEEMALAHGAEPRKTTIDTSEATAITDELVQTSPQMMDESEVDTTAQQVESLAPRDGRSIEVTREMVELCIPVKPDIDPPTTDSTGTPWDERIHSTSKALNVDGTWRLRRKPKDMDEAEWAATIQRVQDELRFPQEPVPVTPSGEELCIDEGCDHHGTPHICVTPEPHVTPPGDDFHTDAGVVTEQTVAGIPPIPVPPPVVVAPPVPEFDDGVPFPPSDTVSPALERMADHTVWDFPRLMTFLTERHGKIDVATVNTLLAQDGMSSVQELNAHPDKIGPFVARVKAHLGE
ncbi:hypothetical protein SBP_00030 [Klebsiella phage SBP]|uniref:Uncharacterized protein n=1 Tax=Klebsiella phage SBP TaxID=2973661 RepID=A0A9X9P209_9CAUD|nr:hypothetical protein PQZ68_gp30 [Klebsiella phage SBP]UYE94782.1 hypothetical protein SBP_00030 [Klebsiella phage SBP]